MRRIITFLAALLLSTSALAQSVQQSGNVTPGHFPYWVTNGVIGDGGTAASGNITALGVTASGPGICQNSGPITGPYQQLCFGVTSTGGTISFGAFGGATPGGLVATINGTSYSFPFTPPATAVQGPNSSTVGHGACWNNGSGTLLSDCGVANIVGGPVSSTSGDIAVWNNTTGTLLKDTPALQIFGTQANHLFLSGPSSGGPLNPTFRAIVASDLPSVTAVTTQKFLSGSGTYTAPAGVMWIELELQGAGGGGSGSGTAGGGTGGNGGHTCWNTTGAACTSPVYQAGGGQGGTWDINNGGDGGTVSGTGTCLKAFAGGSGPNATFNGGATPVSELSGGGGGSFSGGAGGSVSGLMAGQSGAANTGGGGGGAGVTNTAGAVAGAGGGGGAFCKVILTTVAATYTYAVGAAGTAGTAGTSGAAGGAGGSGGIWVVEHYAP